MLEIEEAMKFHIRRVINYNQDTIKLEDMARGDKKWRSNLWKAAEAHLVVAALITTVAFASCITMTRGFVTGEEASHPGYPLLLRKAAFKAFIITNTISMVLSSSTVFQYLLVSS